MSETKSKIIQFRVTELDFSTLSRLAEYLRQQGQITNANPHLLAKEYCFAMANIVMKMNGLTATSEQDDAIFTLAKGLANTVAGESGSGGGQ